MNTLLKKQTKELFFVMVVGGCLLFGIPAIERMTAPIAISPVAADGKMTLSVFDVGQGDAILAQEGDKQILIDGGPDESVLEKLGNAMPAGDRKIELIVLTHPHSDHVAGLEAVLKRYDVGRILKTDVLAASSVDKRFEEAVKAKQIPTDNPKDVSEEKVGNMVFTVLHYKDRLEVEKKHSGSGDGLNDSSIVGMLIFKNNKILLMGDATMVVEDELIASGKDIKSDLIKIGHHGSAYSTGEKFLQTVSPRDAVISLGKNNTYGFPSWRVLELLKKAAIRSYRTDLEGTVTAITDGQSLQMTAERLK